MLTTKPLRWGAVALAMAGLVACGSDSGEFDATASAAAEWIASELEAEEPSFDAFGVAAARADVIFALASAGGQEAAAESAFEQMKMSAADYIGDPIDPGAASKIMLAALVMGEDPTAVVDGRDLEAEIRATMTDDGSFVPDPYVQSLIMLALGATDEGVPPASVEWLAGQQGESGAWAAGFDPATPDLDTTSLATQAMLAAGNTDSAEAGVAYLVSQQNEDGSWPSAFGDPNANTAGLAGQALRAAGETEAADSAAAFIESLQTDEGGFAFVASDTATDGYATLGGILALGGPGYWDLSG